MKGPLTATKLRLILSVSLGVITLIAAGIFTYANDQLRQLAIEVNHKTVDANASQNNLAILEKVQDILQNEKNVVERARSIVADSKSYQYQDQIITDLNDFAAKNGVSITNVAFTSTTAGSTPTAPTVAPVAGLKSTSVTVTLKTPVNYNNLLRFLASIEQNLTKMQVSKVSLSRGSTTGVDITSDALTIEVYIR
jgi:hypothetical protein